MGVEPVSLRRLIERVILGELRIPAFQRGFVWNPNKVQFLMDSIYKGYPVGTLLVWRAREKLTSDRALGQYLLPDPKADYPIDYVLDGQQRLTSLFGVFQTELEPSSDIKDVDWLDVYFDVEADVNAQDSQFLALKPDEVVDGRHFPLKALFNTVEYRKLTRELSDDKAAMIDNVQTQFKEAHIPVETIETEDRGKIAIIFERVNRAGVPLDTYQLLSAWTWSEDFDLRNKFEELGADLDDFGFGEIREEQNLLLRCCGAVVSNNASSHTIISLNGADVRVKFDEITKGIYGAIDFLRRNCGVESLQIMPYPAMIVPLAKFFATDNNAGIHPNAEQSRTLKRWFWRSCFNRRYSSSVDTALDQDIRGMQRLRENDPSGLDKPFDPVTSEFFMENQFSLNAVNTQTFVLLLASNTPRSFLSGAPVDLQHVLQSCNRTEFHHIFPKAYLASIGVTDKREQFKLANFCFLSQTDNRSIKNKAPYIYNNDIHADLQHEILSAAFIPDNGLQLPYPEFLIRRTDLLVVKANRLCSID